MCRIGIAPCSSGRYHDCDMQIPKRRSSLHRKHQERDDHLSAAAVERIRKTIDTIERFERPKAVEELSATREMGDLSENAAYSEAKARVARLDGKLFSLKERLKHAILIRPGADASGRARIGSTVTVEIRGKRKTYEITGSLETDPAAGRVSHLSPLGAALLGKKAGETAVVVAGGKRVEYVIAEVR